MKNVSADSKNNTLEFNEFIKMVALDMKTDATKNRDELFEAFRWMGMMNMNLLKIMNQCREFDKDEDGKLSEAELREIMVSLGEEPVTEQEFKHFIKVEGGGHSIQLDKNFSSSPFAVFPCGC